MLCKRPCLKIGTSQCQPCPRSEKQDIQAHVKQQAHQETWTAGSSSFINAMQAENNLLVRQLIHNGDIFL